MSYLLDGLVDVLAYILGWRAWLCFLVGLVPAYFLAAYDVFIVWPNDLSVFVAILGLGLGIYWEACSG